MKRLFVVDLVGIGGCSVFTDRAAIGGHGGLAFGGGDMFSLLRSTSCASSTLLEQKCGLRNLHQYPHARYKSLVKDRHRFARNWWLTAGNNYELVSELGHEREATENFGVYRDDSNNDRFVFSTNRLEDLPPAKRLDALVSIMTARWMVKDANRGFDKAKLLLQALECFSELRLSGQIQVFKSLPEPDQDTFLQYADACVKFAQACVHSHPDAVAVMLRATQICDEMRCEEKRDELLRISEIAIRRMDRSYAFLRPNEDIALTPPAVIDAHTRLLAHQTKTLKERFAKTPWILEESNKPKCEYLRGARGRRIYLSPMEPGEVFTRMMMLHSGREKDH